MAEQLNLDEVTQSVARVLAAAYARGRFEHVAKFNEIDVGAKVKEYVDQWSQKDWLPSARAFVSMWRVDSAIDRIRELEAELVPLRKLNKMHAVEVTMPACENCGEPLFRDSMDCCARCGHSQRIGSVGIQR